MLSRSCGAGALAVLLACAGGCGSFRCGGSSCDSGCTSGSSHAFEKYTTCCETCGGGYGCSAGGACGSGVQCGSTCGAGCSSPGGCGDSCGGVRGGGAAGCGGKCGDGACGCGKPTPCGLLNAFCACAGCGERYWNEWYNDPPACAEPCDCYGNWVGPGHGGYYRAPYRMHGGYVAEQPAGPPPLELADAPSQNDAETVVE